MNLSSAGNLLLILLLIGWFGYRQTTWRPVAGARTWTVPIVMLVAGVALTLQQAVALTGIDVAVLAVEVLISVGVGVWMGAIAHFRRTSNDGGPVTGAAYESRTGWWGLALWLVVIAVRVAIDVFAVHLGARAVTATGVILVLLAANRLARSAVLTVRLERFEAVASARLDAPVGRV